VEQPDAVVVHEPSTCGGCGQDLGGASVLRRERRRGSDLPPLRVQVVEHQAETRRCRGCGQETTGSFPADGRASVQYGPGVATLAGYLHPEQALPGERTGRVLDEVFGCPISNGTLERMAARCADAVRGMVEAIKQAVIAATALHPDETGLRLNGKTTWLHVASTQWLTWYAPPPTRGREVVDALGVLPAGRGGWSTMDSGRIGRTIRVSVPAAMPTSCASRRSSRSASNTPGLSS
jgi:transposase